MKTTIVIPNYNGISYLRECVKSLREDLKNHPAAVIIVDNGSEDGSVEWIKQECPDITLIPLKKNTGFPHAVNVGIRHAKTPFVLLLNNDTVVHPGFTKALEEAISGYKDAFSVSAKMLSMKEEGIMDNAGDLYCALGWAFARGKDRPAEDYNKPCEIFSACGGAAIYRKSVFEKIGYFDDSHFAYLEDVDIGWRAKIYGYRNFYEPKAEVLHAGSAASGSRYNAFKVSLSSANSVAIIGKNMPLLQIIVNLPFLLPGFLVKFLFFVRKGYGKIYAAGCLKGFMRGFTEDGRKKKVYVLPENLGNYMRIQLVLWGNLFKRFAN